MIPSLVTVPKYLIMRRGNLFEVFQCIEIDGNQGQTIKCTNQKTRQWNTQRVEELFHESIIFCH